MKTMNNQIAADQKLVVKNILHFAAVNHDFWLHLKEDGKETIAHFPLSNDAMNALISGDLQWVDENVGGISARERELLIACQKHNTVQ